jgi:cytochrome b6-f complex iron-sulfur subunit
MATTVQTPEPKTATVPKPQAVPARANTFMTPAELAELGAPMTRREFFTYMLFLSLAAFGVTLGGAFFLYALPRFAAGEFGGTFDLGTAQDVIPPTTAAPESITRGHLWLVNLDAAAGHGKPGVLALYNVCPHLGCLYQWQPVTNRFECPCHGSKYQKDGTYIEGPAPRSLDRFVIRFLDPSGKEISHTDSAGDPLPIPNPNAQFVVDTGHIILGKPHG